MNAHIHALRMGTGGLALLITIGGATSAAAQTVTADETVRSVRKMLERLPYYGVFDFIVFRVDRGTVYLAGYSFEGRLRMDAGAAAKRASGIVEVANKIEVLSACALRWSRVFASIELRAQRTNVSASSSGD